MNNPYAIGKLIYLRAPAEKDLSGKWYEWFSDPEVTQYLADRYWPNSIEKQISFYDSIKNSNDRLVLAICLKESDAQIGICNISSINWVHRYADIALVIGERNYRNGSIGIETIALLLDVAFNRLNLLNIRSSHISNNPFTPLLLRIFGFIEVGRFVKIININGKNVDMIQSQLSRENWALRNSKNIDV